MSKSTSNAATAEAADTCADVAEELVTSTSQPENASEVKSPDGVCVYIGPSIRGVIQRGTIYPGSKPKVLADKSVASAVKKYPLIEKLIVSENSIAQDRASVKTPGSLLYLMYQKLASTKEE